VSVPGNQACRHHLPLPIGQVTGSPWAAGLAKLIGGTQPVSFPHGCEDLNGYGKGASK